MKNKTIGKIIETRKLTANYKIPIKSGNTKFLGKRAPRLDVLAVNKRATLYEDQRGAAEGGNLRKEYSL